MFVVSTTWVALIEDFSEEHGDFFIRFMHPCGPSKLFHCQTMTMLVGLVKGTYAV